MIDYFIKQFFVLNMRIIFLIHARFRRKIFATLDWYVFVAFLIYRILLIELSVLSQFQIPLKLRRRVIIARIIRSGYNLIKAWKRLASAKTLQTHFSNRIIYLQKLYFTTSKLLRSTIPKIITLPHIQERPQNKSTNNYSIFSTFTKSTINYRKKTTA